MLISGPPFRAYQSFSYHFRYFNCTYNFCYWMYYLAPISYKFIPHKNSRPPFRLNYFCLRALAPFGFNLHCLNGFCLRALAPFVLFNTAFMFWSSVNFRAPFRVYQTFSYHFRYLNRNYILCYWLYYLAPHFVLIHSASKFRGPRFV